MNFDRAPELDEKIREIVEKLGLKYIIPAQVVAFRSVGSKARARARIYAMPRIWQQALGVKPHYVIEVLSEHFDHLSDDNQLRVLIHELMHIPKSFSGALVPHIGAGRRQQVTLRTVEKMFKQFKMEDGKSGSFLRIRFGK